MTWRKTGSEFDNECAHVDLSNGAYRTHMEAIGHVYDLELMNCRVPKRSLPRFASSPTVHADITELLDHGFWIDRDDAYEIAHHGDVIRQSLAAQSSKRERDKKAQRRHRARQDEDENTTSGTTNVSADVSAYVSGDTDSQTDKQLEGRPQTVSCRHWSATPAGCSTCEAERKSA